MSTDVTPAPRAARQAAALQIANDLERLLPDWTTAHLAAAELRRQHATLTNGWVRVDERMPEPGVAVLLDIGTHTPIRAMWAAKHTIEAGDECPDGWGDYDEASDTYYCPEGWYEWNRHEETHWAVSEKAIAWMPLPATLNKQGGAA